MLKRLVPVLFAVAVGGVVSGPTSSAATDEYARPAVKASTALRETVHELSVDGVALQKVIDYLRQVSGANIVVDWKVLETAGIDKETPVTLNVRDLSLRKMLQLVLSQASGSNAALTYVVDSNVISITTQDEEDKHMVTKVYIIDDLIMTDNNSNVNPPSMDLSSLTRGRQGGSGGGGSQQESIFKNDSTSTSGNGANGDTPDKKGEDLATLIREVVRPNIWRENGGQASIRYFSGKLIVTAPISVQEAIGGPYAPEGGQRLGL